GGMGEVYEGFDRLSGKHVAVKVIRSDSQKQRAWFFRFFQEATASARVEHPAVVRSLHVDLTPDGLLFQLLELVVGQSLEWLSRSQGFSWSETARVGAIVADALAAAHAVGVIHRDVKPSNIMLTPDAPGVKLLDFGIARLSDQEALSGPLTR